MTEELGAISVGLRVGLGTLDRDLARIKGKIDPLEREHVIPFKVGRVNVDEIRREIAKITRGQVNIPVSVTLPANAGRVLHRELTAQLRAVGPVPVQIKANLSRAEILRFRREVEREFRKHPPISLPITGHAGAPGAPAGSPAPTTPTPAGSVRSRPAGPSRASSAGPMVGPSPTWSPAAIDAFWRKQNEELDKKERAASRARTQRSKSIAQEEKREKDRLAREYSYAGPTAPEPPKARAPRKPRAAKAAAEPPEETATTPPVSKPLTYGPTPAEAGFAIRTKPGGGPEIMADKPRDRTARYLRKKTEARAGRTVSTDTIRREKARPNIPETPEEIEYAARPTQVSYHGAQEEMEFQEEKRSRGVRGASRSGARQRNEPVLLPADYEARDIQQSDEEVANAARRTGEIGAPARRSRAFYGSRAGTGSLFGKMVSKLQFYQFDPVLGQAFEALNSGELGEARALLEGFSGRLAGVDPRQRKKFFRLFRNTENAPPEVLEKHAALQSLFAQIANEDATNRLAKVEAEPVPKRIEDPEGWTEAQGRRRAARKYQIDVLRGIRQRAGGGRVFGERGSLPVFGRGLKGIKAADFGEIGDTFTSLYGFPYTLKRVPVSQIKPSHGVVEERVGEYSAMGGTPPPLILGPRGVVQDGHHRLEMARRAGQEAVLAYVFSGKEEDLPPELAKKLGIPGRAGGGRVEGPLAKRIRMANEKKYRVGETRPETFLGNSGAVEIIGDKGEEIRSFPEDGKILPYVPEWVRRGMAKDLTRRAPGGPVFKGRLAAEQGSGLAGRKVYRDAFEGERAAIGAGQLGSGGGVQRVFVVNWPAAATSFVSSPSGASRAAGPMRFGTDKEAEAFAKSLGNSFGRQLKDLIGQTKEVEPKEPTPETSKPGPITAEERVGAKLEAVFGEDPRALRERLTGIRSGLSETQQYAPVRSLAPAVGQQVATFFGRGELLSRLAKARDLTAQATKAEGIYNAEVEKEIKIQKQLDAAETPEQREELTAKLGEQSEATKAARVATAGLVEEAEAAAKSADALSLKVGTLVGNTLGIIGGTLLFGASLGVAQAGLSAVAEIMGPVIERFTGFTATSAKVTSQLADQTKQMGGASEAALALVASQSGISDATFGTISPLLRQRAQVEAGNKTLLQGIDLLHTYEEAQRRGGAQGIRGTTGGFLGSIIGGTPSTQEIIKRELNDANARPAFTGPADIIDPLFRNEAVIKAREARARGESTVNVQKAVFASGTFNVQDILGQFSVLDSRVGAFNDALKLGGSNLKFLAGVTPEVAEAFAKVAEAADLTEVADTARGPNRVILVDKNNNPVTQPQQIEQALEDLVAGQQTADPKVLIRQLTERIIPAARSQFAAQGRFERGTMIPGQFALGEIAQPTPGTGQIPFGAGLVGRSSSGQIDADAQRAADAYQTKVGGAIDFVNAQIKAGREQLVNLVPANLRGEFTSLLDDIESTGKAISQIQLDVQQQQVNLAVDEYNNQLRIARRSLQDAKDLQAGIRGETRNTLGGIEGQNIALQRQLQLLQFELQQRQINFRLATAGFVAPGTTPEERAARIEAAKQEAAFAQKQLDIQKQLAGNQFKTVQITADRGVTDILAQISLLEQGREVTINVASASRALDILNKKQALLVQQAGTFIEEGVKITQAAIEAAAEIQRQTGKAFGYLLGETAKAWGIFGEQAAMILNSLRGSAPLKPTQSPGSAGGHFASGIVGDTTGPYTMTVGEAKGEKVAVLKDPKLVSTSALDVGYGGGNGRGSAPVVAMTVIISGNSIRADSDLVALAEMVTNKVEERLMQKTSLFGLRRA